MQEENDELHLEPDSDPDRTPQDAGPEEVPEELREEVPNLEANSSPNNLDRRQELPPNSPSEEDDGDRRPSIPIPQQGRKNHRGINGKCE